MEEDEGDQMWAPPPQGKKAKGGLTEYGITPSEAAELRDHEQSIMEEGRKMDVRFDTHKSEKSEKSETVPIQKQEPQQRFDQKPT